MKKPLFIFIAFIAAIIVSYNVYQNHSQKQLLEKYDQMYAESFEKYPNVITTASRSSVDELTGLERLMQQYENDRYEESLAGFNEYVDENPHYYQAKFYRGLTYLQLNQADKAIPDLQAVVEKNQDLSDQAEWYLALALIKQRNMDVAIPLLETIAAKSNSQSQKAQHLLNKIS